MSGARCVFAEKSPPLEAKIHIKRYWPITETYIAFSACACCGLHYFHENPSIGSQDTDQTVLTYHRNLHRLQRMRVLWTLWTILFSWKSLQCKPRYRPNGPFLFMSSTISTDLSQPKLTLLANSLDTVISKPALYRLLTFQVPNLISLLRCLGCTEVSVQVRGFLCEHFVTWYVYWRPFRHPQPEDAPWRGDRDPLIVAVLSRHKPETHAKQTVM